MFISPSTEGFSRASELEGDTAARAPGRAAVARPKLHAAPAVQLHGDTVEILHRVVQARFNQRAVLSAQLRIEIHSLLGELVANLLAFIRIEQDLWLKGCNTAGDHYWVRTINPLRVDITRADHYKTVAKRSRINASLIKISSTIYSKACRSAVAPNVFLKA